MRRAPARKGYKKARDLRPDLILLDLMLPGMDGLEVCRRLRQAPDTKDCPIIMLTAKGEEHDIVKGLELGADDYIPKPFSPQVLLARVKAVLRRRTKPDSRRRPRRPDRESTSSTSTRGATRWSPPARMSN